MSDTSFDARALRTAFGAFPTGVTVVTTHDPAGNPIGFTANSFTSVSLDPPLLLVCLAKTSRNFAVMTQNSGFAVNILSETQKDVSNTFARPVEDRFSAVDWTKGPYGSPVFSNVAAWFDCSMEQVIEAGDHVILMGRVQAFADNGLNGLGYAKGSYFTPGLAGKAVSAAADGTVELSAVLERNGSVLMLGEDRLHLPTCAMDDTDPTATLGAYLQALTGLPVSVGFLYSVYESRADSRQHIVYHASIGEGEPANGRFLQPGDVAPDRLANPATADILRRFAAESSIGNFGVYFGNETAGKVHPVARKA
ncbi:flavin reductase family protein [Pararhizobium antarcticum]|uniref:Flavin reductase n=1 Tax=Pararhizobium antarcticum TaxID=1798805 RepID=A0A657LPV5_9HYPH|nr:flavin reductase family protein [Pararhizobium antarcticum]OJF94407.1 flavin reductase [Pararhizobium antarcticum]OJF95812.1 flavin reductase [Rhizobium sp. 58]